VTPDRWKRLRVAIEAALDAPPERVDAVLSSLCADDPSLIAEARSMLRAAESAQGFLETASRPGDQASVGRAVGDRPCWRHEVSHPTSSTRPPVV
jgi:hypothetical protein